MSGLVNLLKHPLGRELLESWRGLEGLALVKAVLAERSLKTVVSTSFGAESAVLLDLVARVDPSTPVVFVDTGRLFEETHSYRKELVKSLDLLDVRVVSPSPALVQNMDPDGALYRRDPDGCCQARKVMPYALAMSGFDVILTGRKHHHGGGRAALGTVETAGHHVKVNPLAHYDADDIEAAFVNNGLPRHPLAEAGYPSIGCEPCTARTCGDCGTRAGRWAGHDKTECGIHLDYDLEILATGT